MSANISKTFWAAIRQSTDSSRPYFLPQEMSGCIERVEDMVAQAAASIPNWHAANPVIGYRRVQCTILPE